MKTKKSLVDELMDEGVIEKVFPGASLCVIKNGKKIFNKVYGWSQIEPRHKKMTRKTIFDIASLTKPFCTATLTMLAYQEGRIDLDEGVDRYFVGVGRRARHALPLQTVRIRHLLNHTSGLPDYKTYYKTMGRGGPVCPPFSPKTKNSIIKKILSEKLLSKPGEKVLYSDLGYILLGVILEKIYDAGLDELFDRKIRRPLKLKSTFFIRRGKARLAPTENFAATEFCEFRKRMIVGEVMDENCYALGGVAGHAGLFSNTEDIGKWLLELRRAREGKSRLIRKETFELFCAGVGADLYVRPGLEKHDRLKGGFLKGGHTGPPLQMHSVDRFFTLGFETPSHPSSSGHYFSPNSLGHLGYTGTSFWWDVEKDWMVIFLTNRVHPTRENKKIQEFRPKLHDLIVKSVLTQK